MSVTVEPCRKLYNIIKAKDLIFSNWTLEVVLVFSAKELTGHRLDDMLRGYMSYDLVLGNLTCRRRTGNSINGD